MTSKMRSQILKKSTPGALRDHMGPKEAPKGGLAPSGVPFSSLSALIFYVFQYYSRLPFDVQLQIKPTQTDHKADCLSLKTTTGDGPPGEINCRRPRLSMTTTTADDHGRRPRATGHLVKTTTADDHDHGRRTTKTIVD